MFWYCFCGLIISQISTNHMILFFVCWFRFLFCFYHHQVIIVACFDLTFITEKNNQLMRFLRMGKFLQTPPTWTYDVTSEIMFWQLLVYIQWFPRVFDFNRLNFNLKLRTSFIFYFYKICILISLNLKLRICCLRIWP